MSQGIIVSLCDYSGAWSRPFVDLGYTVLRVDPMHDAGVAATEGTRAQGSFALRCVGDGDYTLAATAGQLAAKLEIAATPDEIAIGAALRYFTVGVLMAPPCTHFAGSGARWWAEKDARGHTAEAVQIVRDCLRVVELCGPQWWALENPVGRIAKLVPELQDAPVKYMFDPCDFAGLADDPQAESYTKRTCLWGQFAPPPKLDFLRREPVMVEKRRKDGTVVRGSWMWANLGGKSERTKALRSKTPTGFARAFAIAQVYPEIARREAA